MGVPSERRVDDRDEEHDRDLKGVFAAIRSRIFLSATPLSGPECAHKRDFEL